mgnify:CR=1 FL=1
MMVTFTLWLVLCKLVSSLPNWLLQEVPIEDAGWLMYYQYMFSSAGTQCWASLSLESLLQQQVQWWQVLAIADCHTASKSE